MLPAASNRERDSQWPPPKNKKQTRGSFLPQKETPRRTGGGGGGRLAVALVQQLRDVKDVATVFLAFSYWSQDGYS